MKKQAIRARRRIGNIKPPGKGEKLVVFADEDGAPRTVVHRPRLSRNGGLRDVHGADDLVGDAVDFFFSSKTSPIELHVSKWCEHFRG